MTDELLDLGWIAEWIFGILQLAICGMVRTFCEIQKRNEVLFMKMLSVGVIAAIGLSAGGLLGAESEKFVRVSARNPRYFETADGQTWVPVGCNVCFDRLYDGKTHGDAAVRANFARWMRTFAANGGNCMRLWLGHASVEVEPVQVGVFDREKTETLRGIVRLAEELGIRLKLTLESFRACAFDPKAPPSVFMRPAYANLAKDFEAFFGTPECRAVYLNRAKYFKALGLGDSPAVYCWELWNEISATSPISVYAPWSDDMLAALKELFPKQMVVQNLGSLSDPAAYQAYDQMATVKDNDFLQVHRYLDPGAQIDACRGPMDVVAASATRELLTRRSDKPVVVAEIGAVKANHTGPSVFYAQDVDGVMLHDAIFAPFFCGAAGCGQPWHWDHQYIDGNGIWWQFGRFATAIAGLDPVSEDFRPFYTESRRLRMYGLHGRQTAILWCRDKKNSWEDEFVRGDPPELLSGEAVPFADCTLDCYLPWQDRHVRVKAPTLPPFKRSIVVRVPASAVEGIVRAH